MLVLEERIKVRKRIRSFYLGLQGILKSAGCYAEASGIKFDSEEQAEAERLWALLNTTLTEMTELLTKNMVRDRDRTEKTNL